MSSWSRAEGFKMKNDNLNRKSAPNRNIQRKKVKLTLQDIRRVRKSGTPVSFNDVLDFHIWLKDVRGIGPADVDFFRKTLK